MRKVPVISDCGGIKNEAITDIFKGHFNDPSFITIVDKSEDFPTPLAKDDFVVTTLKRLQVLQRTYLNKDVLLVTIQKGYYCIGERWYLCACVGMSWPSEDPLHTFTSAVPVDRESSIKKSAALRESMSDILMETHKGWDKNIHSAYTLFTGESEKDWLQKSIRDLLKAFDEVFTIAK